ncbi:WavE lipopolysaccharide synthesis family protein [Photobacterium leiognathi subsp. mandapamensis]|uniref:WavE lipopolysaccharide synthesis family protein n=1 Tax=Photobacterium leiognathi TaxID=553611 RepID=UPI003BF5A490
MEIQSKEISFVIQGAVNNTYAIKVISSIRKNFPESELILSTWNGSNINEEIRSMLDVVLESEDPGDYTNKEDTPINVNRQIVSTRNGISKTTREYIVKTRTDIVFENSNILYELSRNYSRNKLFSISNEFILASDFSTRSHLKGLKVPFWICDFIYAGKRDDIKKLFSLKNYPIDFFSEYEKGHPKTYQDKRHIYKYTPESYISYEYLDSKKTIKFEHSYDNNLEALRYYHNYLINNFVILNKRQLGVSSLKYYLPFSSRNYMFTNTDWRISRKEFKFFSKDTFYELIEFIEWIYIKLAKKRFKSND